MSARLDLIAAYKKQVAAFGARNEARDHGTRAEYTRADVAAMAAVAEWHTLREAARDTFAKSRGWRYDRKLFISVPQEYGAVSRRFIKNTESFRDKNGKVVGLVTHTAATPEELAAYAARRGYNAELLPFSWDAPNYHSAVVLTLKPGATWAQERKSV